MKKLFYPIRKARYSCKKRSFYSIMIVVIEMEYMQYLLIIIILLIIAVAIAKSKRKDFQLEANKLVEYLGGRSNILEYEFNKSRFVVTLSNVDIVNKEGIQKLGAQGIVEIENQLKIILGDNARQLKKYIDALK